VPNAIAEFIKDFAPPVAWIVAVCGFFYNNDTANKREKRKEFRSEIDAITVNIKDINKKMSEYYALESRDAKARSIETEVKILFREIDLKSGRLNKRKLSGVNLSKQKEVCQKHFDSLFELSTGNYFESDDWKSKQEKEDNFNRLNIEGLLLTEAMHSLFLDAFDN
jgi:hypothetical protein